MLLKIDLTFGVTPSYLVRIEHILCVFDEKNIFDEKVFFRSKISDFDQNFRHFEYFQDSSESIVIR